jgi:hypothetical protein
MAWVAILWICGYAWTVQQTKRDTGNVMYTHAGLHRGCMVNEITWTEWMYTGQQCLGCQVMTWCQGDINPGQPWSGERYPASQEVSGIPTPDYLSGERYPSCQTTAMVEDMMPDILRMRFPEWDPGEMDTYSEMYLHEGMHRVLMAKEVIWRYVITGIVMEWDTKQQCHERAMPGGLFKEDEIPGIRQLYENNTVVWDTGQQAHMDQIGRVEHDMVDQSASFGWCRNVRGTDAEGDATSLEDYASQEMVEHGRQYQQQHRARQRPHHHQEGGHGVHHQREALHGHLQQQGGHNLLPRPAGHQPEQQAGRDHYQQRHSLLSQAGRPPDGGYGYEDKYDDINLKFSCRNKCEQKLSVLGGGGASLIGRCRLHGRLNMVCCRVPFRSQLWAEVQARTDTLVRQPPYLVTRGCEEVVQH